MADTDSEFSVQSYY